MKQTFIIKITKDKMCKTLKCMFDLRLNLHLLGLTGSQRVLLSNFF